MDDRTRFLHAGPDRDPATGASSIPVYQASTYAQEDIDAHQPWEYARGGNPTRAAVEAAIAAMEGGVAGFAFASGMAAISSALLLFSAGDHIVVSDDVYGGTYRVLTTLFERWGLTATFVDSTDVSALRAALRPNTRGLFVETPSNPLLRITDLRAMAALSQEKGLLSLVDNTFMTPWLQRPLELGFDVSLHSATKFLGGHSDVLAGLAVARESVVAKRLKAVQNAFGAVLGPQDSWLLLRGMRTLVARMEAQQRSADAVARGLVGLSGIRAVHYPGLAGHPGRDVHLAQSTGGGAVVSFELEDASLVRPFLKAVHLPLVAVSLGGVESILSYPATMSHASMPRGERERRGITDGLVRLSVGLEAPEDLLGDIGRALEEAKR